jgi:hypothetical protein
MQDYLDEMNPTYLVTIKPKGYSGFYWWGALLVSMSGQWLLGQMFFTAFLSLFKLVYEYRRHKIGQHSP